MIGIIIGILRGSTWEKEYPDILYKVDIILMDDGIMLFNAYDGSKCIMTLHNSGKRTGEIYLGKWKKAIPFSVHLYNDNMIFEDTYQYSITFSKK